MIYMIIAITAGLFFYGSFRCWQHYRHRLIQHYPSRRR
ncbi:response regulator [Pantoea dispersa]|nr:response regulator [Pantoea dispersa]MEB5972493.1 response regulator [Pantoea dispersa]